MRLTGTFEIMSISDLVQWARSAQKTGTLHLASDNGENQIRVILRDGAVVWSSTTSRQTFANYIVHLGICTQEQVAELLETAEKQGHMLGSVLVKSGLIDEARAVAALRQKTFEDLCDVFLWTGGDFSFEPLAPPQNAFLPFDLDPIEVMLEGRRRRRVWERLRASVVPVSCFKHTGAHLPYGRPWRFPSVVDSLIPLLDGLRTVDELLELLPFSRFSFFATLEELMDAKVVRPADVDLALRNDASVDSLIEGARQARAEGRWSDALLILEGLSSAHPGRRDVFDLMVEVADGFRESVFLHNFHRDDVPVATAAGRDAGKYRLDETARFVLSRVDGTLTVGTIIDTSMIDDTEALRTIKMLIEIKLIEFLNR